MKINQLRFKNLNSLVGEWMVDFTSPEYTGDGIFSITGPTGAGKSTILDAICLALYGCTPRLSSISASTNEIMSRQTGDCFAEVVFQTNEGCFRAHWSQKRARGKPGGTLQQPRHEISEASEDGRLIASQLRHTAAVIEEKTGMDFKRFTQSMMLAQGGFAAFLQTSGDERAPVLEQITGTEIYSRISVHVFRQNKIEKEQMERLRAESRGIMLMGREEEEKIITELEEMKKTRISVEEKLEKLNDAIIWLRRIEEIKKELNDLIKSESETEKEIKESEPYRVKLKNAMRASVLDGAFAGLKALKDQQRNDLTALQKFKSELPSLQAEKEKAFALFSEAQKLFAGAESSRDSILKLIGTVRLIDQEIAQKDSTLKSSQERIRRIEDEKKGELRKKNEIERSISTLKTELEEIVNYQSINQTDASLIAGFTGIETMFERLAESNMSLEEYRENLISVQTTLKNKSEEIERADQALQSAVKKHAAGIGELKKINEDISGLLSEKTSEDLVRRKDELIMYLAQLKQIADYGSARTMLEDGKPCPLCGSTDHPFARGNIPVTEGTELELRHILSILEKSDKLTKKRDKLASEERSSGEELIRLNSHFENLIRQKKDLEASESINSQQYEKAISGFNSIAARFKTTLLPLGITKIPHKPGEIERLQGSLKARRDKWRSFEDRKNEINGIIQEEAKKLAVLDNILTTKEKELYSAAAESEALRTSMEALRSKRKELFGNALPDEEEEHAHEKVRKAEKEKKNAEEIKKHKEDLLTGAGVRISGLEESTGQREESIREAQENFNVLLAKNGFETEDTFISARMAHEDRMKLEEKINDLDRKMTELGSAKKTKSADLEKEQAKKLSVESREALSASYSDIKEERESLIKEIGLRTGKLNANNEARTRGEEIAGRITAQELVCERWSRLSSLIGSADGRKYRNFAQGLTLEVMILHANKQLAKLSDRYLLVRDREEPLELNVVDNYQAGEIRSTKNLSGGESFIVSLALALGLSGMASRKVSVDSLFLDEGFGSLDEDTLETALGTLASLRQDGKMIGVISHIGAMKDRINTKIIVQPVREGRSILIGPGCKSLS